MHDVLGIADAKRALPRGDATRDGLLEDRWC